MEYRITPLDESSRETAQERFNNKTKPPGSLGKLECLAAQMAAIQGRPQPAADSAAIVVFAADHGISREAVSAFPREVTLQMVLNFAAGGAAINVLCRLHNIELNVVNAGVDGDLPPNVPVINCSPGHGTRNFLHERAMTQDQLVRAFKHGSDIAQKAAASGVNLLGFGEMGIGNTSSAALLTHRFTGKPLDDCTGKGTGLDNEQLARKREILNAANALHDPATPEDVLLCFGGLEIAMMTGAMLKAAELRMVLLVDGYISTAALLAAHALNPMVLGYAVFCHRSAEPGHRFALEYLGVEALLDLGMRLGEGTGCAMAVPILRSAAALLSEMASFETAAVSREKE